MELINKLERTVLGWAKSVPHLPVNAQKWLAVNVWWIILVSAILSGLSLVSGIGGLLKNIALLSSPSNLYYVTGNYTEYEIIQQSVGLFFAILIFVALALAVNPLKIQQKKGWVLLFLVLLLDMIAIVVNAVLTLSLLAFIISIIFGGIYLAILAYFLFEIHGQFARPVKRHKRS